VLINWESNIGAFLLSLIPYLPCYYLCISFIFYTCWVPTISALNIAIFPCCWKLLLRRWRCTRILRREDLGYVSPWLPFLWSYGVFCHFVSLRVIIVFRDIIYIINILYSWHLIIYEHVLSVCVEQLILHIRVFSLVLFWIFAKIFYSNLSPLFLIYKI
jgi:hypothetical protein